MYKFLLFGLIAVFLFSGFSQEAVASEKISIYVTSNTDWTGIVGNGDGSMSSGDGNGNGVFSSYCGNLNIVQGSFQKQTDYGYLEVEITQGSERIGYARTTAAYGIAHATAQCQSFGGGCLIATATYGSELAPQVQLLREIRDNSLLQTESGTVFMKTFNEFYYSFSPTIADWERESPVFKEAVKLVITPMITTLSIMENANSESEVLGIGISVIALNLGMYLGVPAVVIVGIKKRF